MIKTQIIVNKMNWLLKMGCYHKIYDSYRDSDIYIILYDINFDLANTEDNDKNMKILEMLLLSLRNEHLRVYEECYDYYKKIMVKESKKLVQVLYFERKIYME